MMSRKRKGSTDHVARSPPAAQRFTKELKTAFWIALPIGVAAVLVVLWPSLFPVVPEQLVKVAWKHDCTCANGWMKSLRIGGFTVQDYELDDTSTMRHQWRIPDSIQGCHPASYLGYFLDGHITADTLHRLARERPQAIGLQQVDTTKPDEGGVPKVVSSQLLLIGSDGAASPWFIERKGGVPN